MGKSALEPFCDIIVKTGEYQKDGQTKARWKNIGTLFSTPHGSHLAIKLDVVPIGGDGWLSVKPKEGKENFIQPKQEAADPEVQNMLDSGEPVNLDDIPF